MKKIKNKKSSPIQIITPQSQITTLWNSPVQQCLWVSFSFSSLDQSLSFSASILSFSSFFFFFFFLPQSWCLAFLNSLYLLILLKPKPKPICLKLLFQINGSLSLAFFFCGFLCIWCCRLAMVRWRAWVCGDQHGGGLSLWIGMVEGVGLWWSVSVVEFWSWHRSEFGSVDDGLHDCFGGWIGNGWWLDWSLVVGFSDGTNWSLVMGFVHRFEFSDGFRS